MGGKEFELRGGVPRDVEATTGEASVAGARAAALIRLEAAALEALAARCAGSGAGSFEQVAGLLARAVQAGHRVVLCGIGKSGLIARKVAATMVSLSVPALFLHPAEAVHGDLGLLQAGDVLLALSYSGETEEIVRLLPLLPARGIAVVSLCGCHTSTLARASAGVLDVQVEREACAHQLAPTASTTAMLAMGDALAVELNRRLGFASQDFAALHPGGQLGRQLTPIQELMHTGLAVPVVSPEARLPAIMHEMSAKRLGMTTVQENGQLLGVLSDGDLRRLMERDGPEAFHRAAAEVMHEHPWTVESGTFAVDALALMETHKITALVVSEGAERGRVAGVVHLHDVLEWLGAREGLRENKLS